MNTEEPDYAALAATLAMKAKASIDALNAAEETFDRIRAMVGATPKDPLPCECYVERVVKERDALKIELQNIANANPREWGDQRDSFQAWAQNRARHAIKQRTP